VADIRTLLACALLLACSTLAARTGPAHAEPADAGPARADIRLDIRLDNGARAVLEPLPGVDAVSVIALYGTGYIDDPPGTAQTVHLIEHLRLTAGTGNAEPGQTQAEINAIGAANAETLAHATYYDYAIPPDALERALRIESDRLRTLRVTREDIEREIPRIRQELTTVLSMPGLPLGKFASMAAAQAWLHGIDTPDLTLPRTPDARSVLAHTHRTHRPGNLTLLISGGFDPANAERILRETIGAVPPAAGGRAGQPRPEPGQLPAIRRARWSLPAHAVFVAMPHEHEDARAELEAIAARASFALGQRPEIRSAFASGVAAASGRLPLFVAVIIGADENADEAADAIHRALDAARATTPQQARASADHLARPIDPLPAERINAIARQNARARGLPPSSQAVLAAQIMGNRALQNLLRERIAPNTALTDEALEAAARSALARENRRVLVISPG